MLKFTTVNIIFSVLLLSAIVARFFIAFSWNVFTLILFTWFALTVFGSAFIRWNYFFKSLSSSPNTIENQIAITFDDGPNPGFTPQILSLLKLHNATATFFCIGVHIKKYPELFKQIIAEGHTVGNHTYTHSEGFGFFSTKKVIAELEQTNALVKKITGLEMQLYRPVFGVTNPRIKRALKALPLISIGWNKRSLDTRPLAVHIIKKRVTNNLKKGDIILLHDSSEKTIAVLEHLLLTLQSKQMQSVSVDTLLKIKAYV
ncbi:polysaccharide deacetylase [Patiriisocius marinistellae]|uniref:Polysaccharide deacetylase n=1 Tax=Patiriisocius marinistellae TaxID=2494560 RepID=A0A5J4FVH1_9FLAO|nr:polysaccharide deacetylase family protein [Patiriisocius marinistellae]GEQ85238.1 polysaccharide deacetylase [Patiriisocius marinistellae]